MTTNNHKQTILAVDDTPENLDVLRGILVPDYLVKAATNGKTALKIADTQPPDLILLDVMMPEMDGYEVCRRLKADPVTAKIPVIFVTAMTDVKDEQRGFDVGAVDYIPKPIQPAIVQARVQTHLALADQQRTCEMVVHRRTAELEESQKAAIYMLGEAGHFNDTNTGVHIWRMAAYSAALARATNWSVDQATQLELAAPMHDTGKIGIPDAILKGSHKLPPDEWDIMKTHTTIGHSILKQSNTPLFLMAADIALCHHEKWDGNGYPQGLAGEGIPESARIVALADVFDALTTRRPYKEAWSNDSAVDSIQQESGRHFEPRLVEAFLDIQSEILDLKEEWDAKEDS
jgi:putative two-component system response regulator